MIKYKGKHNIASLSRTLTIPFFPTVLQHPRQKNGVKRRAKHLTYHTYSYSQKT